MTAAPTAGTDATYATPAGFVPADTRTMAIVHNALRRDLPRGAAVLSAVPYPHDRQRVALAEHLLLMMAFLHKHHDAEESGLYPLVRRDPAAAALLDEMEADHDTLDPGIAADERAARAYLTDPAARTQVIEALDLLNPVLMTHLDREEDLLMPVVSRTVSKSEWEAWEQGLARTRSLPEKAAEGHWILDGATPEETELMLGLVPPPVRWILMNVFGRTHRKRAFARWWSPEYSPWKVPVSGSNSVTVAATPEQVWAVLSDVTRTGEWSHECHTTTWLDGPAAGVGARFRGTNKAGWSTWSRPCTITAWEPGRLLAYETKGPRIAQDSSEWTFQLEPVDGGTRITQTFRVLSLPLVIDRIIWATLPPHRDRNEALRADLERLGALAAAG
jgi:iron-sulfur cluster repair protein YtfE (RIC family)/uncharacterized protein YndB with AHSA1/START domain